MRVLTVPHQGTQGMHVIVLGLYTYYLRVMLESSKLFSILITVILIKVGCRFLGVLLL